MIDWLRPDQNDPVVEVAGRQLPVAVRRLPRARRLTMRLAPDGSEVRVTMPPWGRTRDALVFAEARREWIAGQLARVPAALHVGHGAALPYRGAELVIHWRSGAPRRPRVEGPHLVVGGPDDGLVPRVRRWLEGEALAHLGADLAFYCERADEPLPQLRLSRAQRRWGSCTADPAGGQGGARCIRINWRLIMAPDPVRRSVVAHEVAHLTHFDHSPAFHARLAMLFEDDVAQADDWLRRHGRGLYAAFG